MFDNEFSANILVVDDEENIRNIFQSVLLKAGFLVDVAGNAGEALEAFRQRTYDVVVSDVKMPGMDGIELLKRIKADKEDTVVIMITGHGTVKTAVAAMKLGASDFISKPIVEIESLKLVVERCLENSRLKRKLATLEEVNKMKDEFLSIVSHELRTPLTPVKGSLALLLEGVLGPLNDEQKDVLRISEKEINHLLKIITNLLLMAQLQKEDLAPMNEAVLVAPLIQEVMYDLDLDIKEKGLVTDNFIDGDESAVKGNSYQLKQVFVNIIDNAVKFNKDGGKIILSMSNGNGMVCYEVSDTGVGISAEDYEKIFDRFQQIENHLTRKFGGVGLGLAISKKIIEQHGGEIAVESTVGNGSTFKIFLPRTE